MGLIKCGKVWYLRFWHRGKEHKEAAGRSRREAELLLTWRKVEVRKGRLIAHTAGAR